MCNREDREDSKDIFEEDREKTLKIIDMMGAPFKIECDVGMSSCHWLFDITLIQGNDEFKL